MFVSLIFVTAFYFVSSSRRARMAGDRSLERFSLALLVSLVGYSLSAIFLSNHLGKALWILVGMALALDVMSKRAAAQAPALVEARAGRAYDHAVAAPPDEEQERREAQEMQAVVAAEQRLDRRRAALAEREREFAARVRAFEQLERDREEIAERIARVTAEVAQRRRTLEAEEVESRPTPEPPAPGAAGVTQWSLDTLDELVQAHGAAFPDRLEEWRYYLVYLRDFAGLERVLPGEFDGLVGEVFGDLIALDRR